MFNLLRDHLTDFIGTYTFEELCQEWLNIKSDLGELPYQVDRVGSHWSKHAQVDVIGINWRTKQIVLGECKWGRQTVKHGVIDGLIGKTSKVLPSKDPWQVAYLFFARSPLSATALQHAEDAGAMVINLKQLERDLIKWLEK